MTKQAETRQFKIVAQNNYEVFKDGYFNSEEICTNYNLVLGYATDPEPIQNKKKYVSRNVMQILK